MTTISVILPEAIIGTVPRLFNTCLIGLMPSALAIYRVVHAGTHANKHMRAPSSACRANEQRPAAQAVTMVEEHNVNIN